MNLAQHTLIFGARVYQWTASPVLAALTGPTGGCRFTPTCSEYAIEAVKEHGAARGSALAAWRVCRCNPWGGCGEDPVPRRTHGEDGSGTMELNRR
jgi:putative membrane protein insertion efficiency factor